MIHAENEFVKQKILSREIFLINLRTFNKITAVPGKTGCRASCAAPVFFQTLNASPELAVFHVYAAEGAIKHGILTFPSEWFCTEANMPLF